MQIDRFFSVFKTASRGMDMQRKLLNLSAENIANANTTRVEGEDGPYKPKALRTSLSDDQLFKLKLDQSVIGLKETRNGHLNSQLSSSMQNRVLEEMGPQEEVIEQEKYRYEFDPQHPDADENGMVKYPDLDLVEEMTVMVSANRLFEANLSVIEAEKQLIKRAFEI
jgi:flagellar basal-body rod protein FlgC